MANETRPRREASGTSRIRKTIPSTAAPAPDEPAGDAAGAAPAYPGAAESPPAPVESQRDRQDREPHREEGPADREPIRFIRERDREPVRERPGPRARAVGAGTTGPRPRRARRRPDPPRGNPDGSRSRPRPRRARRRSCRESGPGIPSPAANFRDRPDRETPILPARDRDRDIPPPVRTERPAPSSLRRSARRIIPTWKKTSSATPRSTIATKTSSAARSISPSFRR